MPRYYRVQPAGHALEHTSESSAGDADEGLDVFLHARDLLRLDADRSDYGDEIVVIEGGDWWDNEDVEGVRIDGAEARIVRRLTWDKFDGLVIAALELEGEWWPTRGGYTTEGDRRLIDSDDEAAIAAALTETP